MARQLNAHVYIVIPNPDLAKGYERHDLPIISPALWETLWTATGDLMPGTHLELSLIDKATGQVRSWFMKPDATCEVVTGTAQVDAKRGTLQADAGSVTKAAIDTANGVKV